MLSRRQFLRTSGPVVGAALVPSLFVPGRVRAAAPEPIDVSLEFPSGAADVLVTPLGADRYRLEEDPFCFAYVQVESARELARLPRYADEFEALTVRHHELRFVKVVKRARLKRFQFLVSPATVASPQFARVLSRVEDLNGYWERVFGGVVIIYVPRNSGYDPLEALNRDLDPSDCC